MKKYMLLLAILGILCFTGCAPVSDTRDISHQRVVCIQITAETPVGTLRRCYRDPEHIHRLLHALRLEKRSSGAAEGCHKLRLELRCADGFQKRYFRLQPTEALWSLVLSTPGQPDAPLSLTEPPLPPAPWHRAFFPALRHCKIPCK